MRKWRRFYHSMPTGKRRRFLPFYASEKVKAALPFFAVVRVTLQHQLCQRCLVWLAVLLLRLGQVLLPSPPENTNHPSQPNNQVLSILATSFTHDNVKVTPQLALPAPLCLWRETAKRGFSGELPLHIFWKANRISTGRSEAVSPEGRLWWGTDSHRNAKRNCKKWFPQWEFPLTFIETHNVLNGGLSLDHHWLGCPCAALRMLAFPMRISTHIHSNAQRKCTERGPLTGPSLVRGAPAPRTPVSPCEFSSLIHWNPPEKIYRAVPHRTIFG